MVQLKYISVNKKGIVVLMYAIQIIYVSKNFGVSSP